MITRMQMPRQLRNKGGITNVISRKKYGIGSDLKDFTRKIIPNEIADVAVKAAPFVAMIPGYGPAAAGIMRGIGRFDQRGSISDALKQGAVTYAGGKLFGAGMEKFGLRDPGASGIGEFFNEGTRNKAGSLFKSQEAANTAKTTEDARKGVGIIQKATDATIGKVPLLNKLPDMVQQQLLVGGITSGASALYSYFTEEFEPQKPGETMGEYMARRNIRVKQQMRGYMDSYYTPLRNPQYAAMSDEEKNNFIDGIVGQQNDAMMATGGRVGYQVGGLSMLSSLAKNIVRNKAAQEAFRQAINPSQQKVLQRLQARQQEPSMMSQVFSGPAFDKYSAERTRAYTESPSRLQYNLDSNKAAGQFIQDKSKEILGDNILGKGAGILATAASVPLAAAITPFHEAAQVVAEGRMKPVSEYSGDVANFTRAFLAEKPLLTAAQRAGGVLQSIPGVGDAVTKAGEKLYDRVQSGKTLTGLEDYLEGTEAATPTPDAGTGDTIITEGDSRYRISADGSRSLIGKIADDGMGRDDVPFYVSPEGTYYPPGYNGTGSAIFVDNLPNKQNQKPTMADVAGPKEGYISLQEFEDMQRNKMYDFMQSPGNRNRPKEEIEENIKFIVDAASKDPDNYLRNYRGNFDSIIANRLASGGMPTGIMRSNKAGVMERDYRDEGGFVPVGIKEKADDVPAMLSKNEFVFTADAVRGAGNGSIEKGAQKMYDTMKNLERRVV